jgi:hypothetical protein
MVLTYLTTVFLILNFASTLPLWQIIHRHISEKQQLLVTLVDWIYRDVIYYNIFLCFFISVGIIHTLLYGGNSFNLSYELGLFYSIGVNITIIGICVSLIFSAGLRLISLIKNSEAAGDKNIMSARVWTKLTIFNNSLTSQA